MAARADITDLSYSQLNAGDEVFDLCCDKCSTQKLNKEAAKYCSVCKEYFCDSCVKNHNSFKALSSHKLVDPKTIIRSSSKTGVRKYQAVPKEMCKTHPMEIINMYCTHEDIVGCSVCFSFEHKSCDDIHYIPEYVQSNFSKEQVDKINNDLTKAIKDMTKLKTHHDKLDDNFEKSKATCKQEIREYREEINHIIDKIEEATLADLDARHRDAKQKTGDTNQNIQVVHDEMMRFKSEIESDQSNDSQKFVIAKLSQCMIKQGQGLQSQIPHDQTADLTFTRNTDIMSFLLSIVTLGMLSPPLMKDSTSPTATSSSKQPQQAKPTTSPSAPSNYINIKIDATPQQDTLTAMKPLKQSFYKILSKSTYNVKVHDDHKTCDILSSCILDNGSILLVDCENKKLKLVDSRTYTVRSSLVLDARPWSVCRVSSTEAAVCLDNSTVQFVSTRGGKLVPGRSVSMKHVCKGIAVIRDKMYVCGNTSVYIYTLNGKLIQTISWDKSGNAIFSGIRDITVSDDEKMIHVTDMYSGVITLNTDGTVKWRYSGTEGDTAWGVCTDGNGNVIVCGHMSDNVIQLSPDGQYMGEIVTPSDGMDEPFTVCYDRINHKLFVGQEDDNNITVFTVQ